MNEDINFSGSVDTDSQKPKYNTESGLITFHGTTTSGVKIQVQAGDNELLEYPRGIVSILKREIPFAVDEADRLYVYRNGVYQPNGDTFAMVLVDELMHAKDKGKEVKMQVLKEAAALISLNAPRLFTTPPVRYINLANGIYDTKVNTLLPHSPRLLTTVQLPIHYDPKATCPHWNDFIKSTFPADTVPVAYELIAWLMIPYIKIKKMILLLGSGNNGKSIFLHGVQAFLGANNYSHIPLHDLASDKFALSGLQGKLANICGEISSKKLDSTDKIKALTGGDSISAERKYGDRYNFIPFARHIYSCNELFKVTDLSEGFLQRFCIIPFTNRFKDDPGLGYKLQKRLMKPSELSGLFNMVLPLVPKIKTTGLTTSKSMKNALEEHLSKNNTVLQFIRRSVITSNDANDILPFDSLYQSYVNYCERRSIEPISRLTFGKDLRKYRPDWRQKRTSDGQRHYYGLTVSLQSFKYDAFDDDELATNATVQ